ncbi:MULTISPECIES: hypothetical protein [Corallococcus]|uniref:hypothetical protein n=1 Tax=Corallococcus TaxID=83461 RepID=UPI00117F4484|nr:MULTISPECIES: hypothetical protein [Corallococcus]NBD08346.1 hypothetical protein [Corallococcus silvisoli]TSC34301.1 hypothetical protein FOF48_04520 [Corallococcus sp. Z5C101001]
MPIDTESLLRRLSNLDTLARAGSAIAGFPWESIAPFANLWSQSWPGEVAEALGDVDELAVALEEDCPAGGPQWIALALRDGSTVPRAPDDETNDVVLWQGSAVVSEGLDAAPLLIVGGSLTVDGWLRVNDGSTVVVAGGLKAHGVRCIGNLVVLGDIEADFVRAEGNGGILFARQVSCRLYDNPHLAVHSRVVAESAVYERGSEKTRPSGVQGVSPESLLAEGLVQKEPGSDRAILDYEEIERRGATRQPVFRGA